LQRRACPRARERASLMGVPEACLLVLIVLWLCLCLLWRR
jgi:hypothetical protein